MFYIKYLKVVFFPQTIIPTFITSKNLQNQQELVLQASKQFLLSFPSLQGAAHLLLHTKGICRQPPPLPLGLTLFLKSRLQQDLPLWVCRHCRINGYHTIVCCQKGDCCVPEKHVSKRFIWPRNGGWNSVLLHAVHSHLLSCSTPGLALALSQTHFTLVQKGSKHRTGQAWCFTHFDYQGGFWQNVKCDHLWSQSRFCSLLTRVFCWLIN